MKNISQIIAYALVLLLPTAVQAAEIPNLPPPRENQFAVELFKIVTPRPFDQAAFRQEPEFIEEMFHAGENAVTPEPVIYTQLGGVAENNQTREVSLPEDYNVVGGKAVPINKIHRIGVRTRVHIISATRTTAAIHIDFHHQVLKGYKKHKLGNGIEVKLPEFDLRQVNADLDYQFNSWVVVGGIEAEEDGQILTSYYIIRISRP